MGYDHEFLEIDVVVRVLSAIDDVHHRDGEEICRGTAEIPVSGQTEREGRSLAGGNGNAEDRVCAQCFLMNGAVQFDHPAVKGKLFVGVHSDEGRSYEFIYVFHCAKNAFAAKTFFVPVAKFHGFPSSRRGSRRDRGPPENSALQHNVHFDSRIPARIEDLPGDNLLDSVHPFSSLERYFFAR